MAKVVLTKEEIEAKKDEFKKRLGESAKEAQTKTRRTQAKEFLTSVSDLISESIKNGVSYKQISKDIYEIYSFKVSEQTVRSFAHDVLKIEKKARS